MAVALTIVAAGGAIAAFALRSPGAARSPRIADQHSAPRATHPALRAVRAGSPQTAQPKLVVAVSAFDAEQRMSFAQLMNRWDPFIAQASKSFGVPQNWIRAVMQAESGGRTMQSETQPIVSHEGAMGLMQLMPSTYDEMRKQYGLGRDPHDPHDNVMAATAYLRWLRAKYGYPQMFAAYNDGPGHLEERMMQDGLLPAETSKYVGAITGALESGRARGGRGNLAKFTRPDGSPVWIDGGAVISVRAAFPGEYAPGVHSVITIGRVRQGVRETLAQARTTIRARGGAI